MNNCITNPMKIQYIYGLNVVVCTYLKIILYMDNTIFNFARIKT